MDAAAYSSLSPRELDCLRLVAEGLQSKEIAARLSTPDRSISSNTVDGYLKSAMRTLGVTTRRDAARLVAEHEGVAPRWLGDQSAGVDHPPPPPSVPSPATSPGQTSFPWPWRRPGEVDNHLSITARLLWIPILAIGLAIGFGSLSSGVKVVNDLVGSRPLLRHSVPENPVHGRHCPRSGPQPDARPQRPGAARPCAPL